MAQRKLEVVITGDSTSLKRALGSASGATNTFGSRMGTAAKRAAKFAAVAGMAGIGLALKKTVEQTVGFDKAMRNVNSIAQLNEKQFKGLSKQVLSLAGKTAQSPQKLAEGLYDLVSSGFDAKESMHVLAASAKAATAGLTTTEVSTKAVAAVLNAYKLPASKAAQVSDALFQTVNLGVVSFEELASTIGDVLPFASSLGVNVRHVGAAISTMTKAGISAPETMTRIKAVMVTMLKPGEALSAAFKKLGVESGEALIKQKGFQGALDALVRSTDGSKKSVAALFPNIRALGGALALTGKNSRGANADLKAFGDVSGATNKALREQSKSVAFQWEKMKATLSALAITVGSKFVPAASRAVAQVTQFVNGVMRGTGAGGRFREQVAGVANTIKTLALTFGPAVLGLGKIVLATAKLGLAFIKTKAGIVTLGAAIGALSARMAALKVLAMITALGGLRKVALVVGSALVQLRTGIVGVNTAMSKATVIGLVATAVGALVGALGALNASNRRTSVSTRDLAEANDRLYEATKRVRDLDLEATQRKLAHRQAVLTLKAAEETLEKVRNSGTATARDVKQAELDVDQARLDVKRTTREVRRSEKDANQVRREGTQASKENREALKGRIETLKRQISKEGASSVAAKLHADKIANLRAELKRTEGQYSATFTVHIGAALNALRSVGAAAQGAAKAVSRAVAGASSKRKKPAAPRVANASGTGVMFGDEFSLSVLGDMGQSFQEIWEAEDVAAQKRGLRDTIGRKKVPVKGSKKEKKAARGKNKQIKADAKAAREELARLNVELGRAKKLKDIDLTIAGVERAIRFKDAIKDLKGQLKDAAREAAAVWRAQREGEIDAEEKKNLAILEDSAEARELAALQAAADADAQAREELELQKALDEAKANGTEEEVKAAEDAIAAYKTQKRIEELEKHLANEAQKVTDAAAKQREGLDAEESAYATSLQTQFDAWVAHLEAKKVSYADFIAAINSTLPATAQVEATPDQEAAVNASKPAQVVKPAKPKKKPKKGHKWVFDEAAWKWVQKKKASGGLLPDSFGGFVFNELGQERAVRDSANRTRVMPASQSRGGGGPLVLIQNAHFNSRNDVDRFANKIAWRVATGAA